jgi:hypothetical protein
MEKTFDFEKIGNRMPYSVPDDFFTKLEESVMDEVKVQKSEATALPERNKTVIIAIRSLLAIAAAVALFFVVQPTLTKNDTISADDYASVELAFNNLSSDDQDFLVAVYENEEFINDLTNDLIE